MGRIFFRTKSDPYVLLPHALASQHNPQCDTACADQVNRQVHQVASYMLSQAYKDDRLINGLDVDKFEHVCVVAPELWEHICSLTQSVNERKGRKAAVRTVCMGESSTYEEHTSSV